MDNDSQFAQPRGAGQKLAGANALRERSVLDTAFQRHLESLSQLVNSIDTLSIRLSPIRSQAGITEQITDNMKNPTPPDAPIVNDIRSATEKIENLNKRVMEVIESIQI